MSPQTRETKASINYWDYTEIKSFFTAKEIISKTTRRTTEWVKIFANDTSDNGFISKM